MNETVIELKDVTKTYPRGNERVAALRGINLSVTAGDFLAVVGPSGSGKTTLLNLIGCLDKPSSGVIRLDGKETSLLSEKELTEVRKRNVGFVFQQFFLIPTLTALENILVPSLFLRENGDKDKKALELSELVGLKERLNHLPSQLSGGEMQRVAIARSLVNSPRLLLADEPTGNLDSEQAGKIIDLFDQLNKNGVTVILVTHNQEIAKNCRRLIKLKDGKIL